MSHVAIVGGGASGALLAIHSARRGLKVTLIERGDRPGRGVAYSTTESAHLLNVRAGAMSAFPDDPGHFARWLGGDPDGFAERRRYGDYIVALLAEAPVEIVRAEVIDIRRDAGGEQLRLADGAALRADVAVLAAGNLAPDQPRNLATQVFDPWSDDIAAELRKNDTVLLIGTGLTAIDVALTLDAASYQGKIVAISRRGLVPRAHAHPTSPPPPPQTPEPLCTTLVAQVRSASDRGGWREAVDQLRPATQQLWASASPAERSRFLRHLRPWWDVHRHRIAPAVADRLARMQAAGRLRFEAGRLVDGADGVVRWRRRGENAVRTLRVARIVNCTGPQADITRAGDPLLDTLLGSGRIRPDGCRLGIDVDDRNRAIDTAGDASDSLLAIGPMTRGAWWEIVAVPDIRVQAAGVAAQLAA